jgi:diguanylate cyclase (GGDEF)-like protein
MDARIAQIEILNEVARIATLDLELRPMLQRITDALARKFEWEFVALITIEENRETFVCQAVTSSVATDIEVGYTRSLGSGIVGEVAATGQPVLVDDVSTFANYVETMQGARSELCVPVYHHARLIAVLNLESTRLAEFHDRLPLLETVAAQLAGAIASAQLIDALRVTQAQLEQKTRDLEAANAHLATAIETLHRISTQDGLTGVANRRHFDETLAVEWRRGARTRLPLSLLMLDIDYFKRFNDASGHQAGDDCLRQVAQCVKDAVHRAADLVARYGGEEFAVLLPDTEAERAIHIAETIRERVESLNLAHPDAPRGHITISIGLATAIPPPNSADAADFIRCADSALYDAKRTGRNKVAS